MSCMVVGGGGGFNLTVLKLQPPEKNAAHARAGLESFERASCLSRTTLPVPPPLPRSLLSRLQLYRPPITNKKPGKRPTGYSWNSHPGKGTLNSA